MDKSAEAAQKALYYEQKAKAAESNDAIYLEDEDLVKFRDKLEWKKAHVAECEKRLEQLVERRRKGL